MSTLVHSVYLDSEPGVPIDLDPAGTSLENPYVYDSAARELKSMATQGLVEITHESLQPHAESSQTSLISRIGFKRLR
jgi:hypothetical protein